MQARILGGGERVESPPGEGSRLDAMMSIGEFAQLTGLSIKALRRYDEQGVLQPAAVDPWSRHRRYSAPQLDKAVRLKALRAAGIGLADGARALEDPRQAAEVLAEHRAAVLERRRQQDAALNAAEALLRADGRGWDIVRREAAPQHWAAVVMPVDPASDDDDSEEFNNAFAALWKELKAEGNLVTGPFWTSIRGAAAEAQVALLCCWPVARALPRGWSVPGLVVETGQIEAGPELALRWRHDDPVPPVKGAMHPAILALLIEAERCGADPDLAGLRQIGVLEDGESIGVEVSIPLTARS